MERRGEVVGGVGEVGATGRQRGTIVVMSRQLGVKPADLELEMRALGVRARSVEGLSRREAAEVIAWLENRRVLAVMRRWAGVSR